MKKKLKRIFEKIMYLLFSNKKDVLIEKKVSKYLNVSFDIFDTLIKRDLSNPEEIFEIMEKEIEIKYGFSGFKDKRLRAYKKALKKTGLNEVTLDDIYNSIDGLDNTLRIEIMKYEIDLEKKYCTKNPNMFHFYNYCIDKNISVYITSDMYLPYDVIKKILNDNGYVNFKKIYLSSSENETKKSGKLFKKLLENEGINKKDIIHIGDSPLNDYLMAKKNGIASILIRRTINNCEFIRLKNKNSLNYFINNHKSGIKDSYYNFGYEIFGPLLYGFCNWLNENLAKDNIRRVFFLARDSKIVMDAFNLLCYSNKYESTYLHLSRKSVLLASIADVTSFDDLLNCYKSILKTTTKMNDFYKILNLNKEKKLLFKERLISTLTLDEKNEIFCSIHSKIKEISFAQQEFLKQYLFENNVYGKVAFVDIGWRGTIQYMISSKYNNIDIYGYYFGINKDKNFNNIELKNRKGYLFDNSGEIDDNQSIISLNIGIFETMFLTNEGSTNSYKLDKNKNVIPVKEKVDNNDEDYEKITNLKNGALNFITDISNSDIVIDDKNLLFDNYRQFTIKPLKKYIYMFNDLKFRGVRSEKLVNNKRLVYYVFHPKKFYVDFNNSYCKIFFLKNLFKIRFPYYDMLNYIYKKIKR